MNRRYAEKPNILFILADDLGWGDVGYHGSVIRTPNIDRLVSIGIELDQHYVSPICTPTRASLLTGRYPSRFGSHATVPTCQPVLPDGYETLATSLRNAGYDTALFGKWHLGSDLKYTPNNYGFNTSYGSMAGGVDPYNHCYKKGKFSATWHRNGELITERGHVTDLITREAIEWIETRDRPWFCHLAFTAVHIPIKAPEIWLDKYQYETYDEDPAKDRSFKRYAAYASHMDYAVGQLIESLKCTGQFEKTIIVFTSDNGAIHEYPPEEIYSYPGWQWETPRLGSNLPLRGEKGELYEGGVRTPTIISWPGTLQPGKCEYPLQIVDWMPTFTRLVGYEPCSDPCWDGIDIWPVLSGGGKVIRERPMYWNISGTKFAIRDGDWKLIINDMMKPEEFELYNIRFDPYERENRIKNEPELVKRLLNLLARERSFDDSSKRPDIEGQ